MVLARVSKLVVNKMCIDQRHKLHALIPSEKGFSTQQDVPSQLLELVFVLRDTHDI